VSVLLFFSPSPARAVKSQPAARRAQQILDATGVQGGLVAHLGCGDGKLTAALHAGDSYLVHGLDTDEDMVAVARTHIRSEDLYGNVSVDIFDGRNLPYADNLVRLVISERPTSVPRDELLRVLAPNGVAYLKRDGKWTKSVKAWPEEIDEWTHFLHDADNNAVARDLRVGPPKQIQWVAEPLYCRSHEIDSSLSAMVSAQGRLFYIYDEQLIGITDERLPAKWSLIARDAFSGVMLWKRPIERWGWREWNRAEMEGKDWTTLRGLRGRAPNVVARRLVAQSDRLYATLGYIAPVSILDAATGNTLTTCAGTEGADEIVCSGDVVVICVRDLAARQRKKDGIRAKPERIVALNARTGKTVWSVEVGRVSLMSLAVQGQHVVFCTGKELVCLDLRSGDESWRVPREGGGTLVALKEAILVRDGDRFEAFSTTDGTPLWEKKFAGSSGAIRADLFVAQGLAWHSSDYSGLITEPAQYWDQPFKKPRYPKTGVRMLGVDPLTGIERKTIDIANLVTPGHHFRCYRSKATERYILWPKRAVEFIDLEEDDHMRHDWVRGPCKYGVMPCNGLLYVPPNQCFCYQGVNLRGFNVLAPASSSPPAIPEAERLVRGPAYARRSERTKDDPADWPTFRHDPRRSGSTETKVAAKLSPLWRTKLGGRLTQPVVAGGTVYVATVDSHTLHVLDAATGKVRWERTAGGRIDSPPTVHKGLLLFGSADGRVTCLHARDGALAWQFFAAPADRRVVSFGQTESAWPVHGSVLILDDLAYVAAGRSSYLDGGIYLYALDPVTGRVVHRGRIDGPHPDLTCDIGEPFSMEGTFSDVLVTDGTYLYMQQIVLDRELKQNDPPKLTNMGDKKFGQHVFSTAGFLDDTWWNRMFWMHSERYPGFYIAQQAPKSGQLLVFDETTSYGVKCYTKRNVHSPMFFPGTDGYLLVADDNDNEPMLVGDPGAPEPLRWLPQQHPRKELQLKHRAVDFDKGVGFTRARPPKWQDWVPIRIRAMVAAADRLFVAGPPDVLNPQDPMAAFEGRAGGLLRVYSTTGGKPLGEHKLDSPPVFDGMIAARGRLFLSACDGTVRCLGAE
jgi:outer membrane protein assembly factor BamB